MEIIYRGVIYQNGEIDVFGIEAKILGFYILGSYSLLNLSIFFKLEIIEVDYLAVCLIPFF